MSSSPKVEPNDDHLFVKPEGLPPRHYSGHQPQQQRQHHSPQSWYSPAGGSYHHQSTSRESSPASDGHFVVRHDSHVKSEYTTSLNSNYNSDDTNSEYSYDVKDEQMEDAAGGSDYLEVDSVPGGSQDQLPSPTPKVSSTTGPEEIGWN